MDDLQVADLVRTEGERLGPDDVARARMRARLDAHVAGAATAVRRERRTRRRRPAFAAVAMIAVVIVVAIAVAPDGDPAQRTRIAPATAQAALREAADAAGDASWHPLADGEYHHVYTSSFDPVVPATKADPREQVDQLFNFSRPEGEEQWLDRTGRGMELRVTGGSGDPTRYPRFQPRRGGSHGVGWSPSMRPGRPAASVQQSLRYPDMVNVVTRQSPVVGNARMRTWGRTSSGFTKLDQLVGPVWIDRGADPVREAQVRTWGASLARLERLDENPTSRAALDAVLDERETGNPDRPGYGWYGQAGMTAASVRREGRIRQAIKVLGSAPLSPSGRRSLFNWLEAQPGARLDGSARDQLDRRGTRITFETEVDLDVPARSVTTAKLLRDAVRDGLVPTGASVPAARYDVSAHREYRRVYMSIVLDRSNGEVLESSYYERWSSTARIPYVWVDYWGRVKVLFTQKQVRPLGAWGGELFITRERATDFDPDADVCREHPDVCE